MVGFYLLTFPRFPLRKKEHKSYFGKNRTHDFRTSRCAAYLLDHSGDDCWELKQFKVLYCKSGHKIQSRVTTSCVPSRMYVCMVIIFSRSKDQPGKVANATRGQLNGENNIFLSPFAPKNLFSQDGFGRPVPCQPPHSPYSG